MSRKIWFKEALDATKELKKLQPWTTISMSAALLQWIKEHIIHAIIHHTWKSICDLFLWAEPIKVQITKGSRELFKIIKQWDSGNKEEIAA